MEIYRCDILHSLRKAGQPAPVTQAPEESWIKGKECISVVACVCVCVCVRAEEREHQRDSEQ